MKLLLFTIHLLISIFYSSVTSVAFISSDSWSCAFNDSFSKSHSSLICAISVDVLVSFAFVIIPLFPNIKYIDTPAKINKITVITTSATRVIARFSFIILIKYYHSGVT